MTIKMILQIDKRGEWAGKVIEVVEVKIVTKAARVEDIQEEEVLSEMNLLLKESIDNLGKW